MPLNTGRHAVTAVLLSLVLALSLLLPAVLAPQTTRAEDPAIYALVQMPSLESAKTIKYAVQDIINIRGINALVGCTQEQLDSLVADGYIVADQCTGDECLAQLQTELESLNASQMVIVRPVGDFRYEISEPTFRWIDITGTGTDTGINCDDCGVTVPIGFTFDFFGTKHKEISISSNGFLTFSDNDWQWWNWCIPDPDNVPDSIYVFWDDLYSDCCDSYIWYDTRDIGGRKAFIVEWSLNHFCCSCTPYFLTFEAILFEDSNNILFQYLSMTGGNYADGRDATVGLENQDNSAGFQYSCDSPAIHDSLAILFTREPDVDVSLASSATQPKVSPTTTLPRLLKPPQVSVQYLSVNPQQTIANQPVTITTNVVNIGDQGSNYNVILKINGQVEQTKMVAVGPQASQPVKFTVTRSQPGKYSVDINDKAGSFSIAGDTSAEPVNGGLLVVVIVGFLLLSAAVGLIFALRRSA